MADQEMQIERKTYKIEELLPILIPTKSNRIDINTAFTLSAIVAEMGRYPMVATSDHTVSFGARTSCLMKIDDKLGELGIGHSRTIRGMWIDDDMFFEDSLHHIIETLKWADERHLNLIGNYKNIGEAGTLVNMIGVPIEGKMGLHLLSNMELAKYKNLDPLPPGSGGGLGFYYGDLNLDYKFHYDKLSEDFNFFMDNKMPLCYTDLRFGHDKHVRLR